MSATRILAIRHGETAWNVDTRMQGQLDVPLNDTGRWQAAQLGGAVAHEGVSVVYSSDLSRALATAEEVARGAGLRPVLDEGLRERHFGAFQGRTFAEIEAEHPSEAELWRRRDPDFAPPGGECLRRFYERCVGTVLRIAARHPGETIAVVAHGGVMDCLYRAATHIDLQAPRSWLLGNASINRLLYADGGLSLIGWSDTGHLESSLTRDEGNDGGVRVDRVGHAA